MISNEKDSFLHFPPLFTHKKLAFSVAVLAVFHLVGFWGLAFSGRETYFQTLTPLNLLLTIGVLFVNHKKVNFPFFLWVLITFCTGFFAEVIGVHTGLIFGNYSYGEALGFKLWRVPLMIGLNWVMLVYCTGIVTQKWFQKPLTAAFTGALLMVLLDYFIEPVAVAYDFWTWKSGEIPVWNYVCWFGLALFLQFYFQHSSVEKNNHLAPFVILMQTFFFVALNLFL